MAALLASLHFWTTKDNQFSSDASIGFYKYHAKNTHGNQQQVTNSDNNYTEELKSFCEERGLHWTISNKRPEKLKENLKDLEILFTTYRPVHSEWKSRNVLLLMFNNGAIVKIWIKAGVGDITKIRIDKYLVGKLASDYIVDVLFFDSTILVSYVEAKLTIIQLSRKYFIKDAANGIQFEKLSSLDPKIQTVELNGPNRRKFERKLSLSIQNDQLMVWWRNRNEGMPGQWTPPSTDKEKANLHVYIINRNDLQLICYTRTKCDPIWASFSHLHLNEIHTAEQNLKENEITVTLCIYHVSKTGLIRKSVTTIPLSSAVVCHAINETEDRTLLGCKDGSLVMYDSHKRTTQITKGGFVPNVISWHPSGALVLVGGDKGHLQCYDMALNILNINLLSDSPNPLKCIDLSTYFKNPPTIQKLHWNPLEYSPLDWNGFIDNTYSCFICLSKGPLGVLFFEGGAHNRSALTAMELVTQYVKCCQYDEAINILLNINWNIDSELCFKCLTLIVVSLLKLPMDETREDQLESALGSYYSAPYQLSDVVTLEYHHKMTCLARRFFHHLLRNERFEKAFLLAVDIGARDLFMDIYYVAKDRNERVLSQAALDRANQLGTASDSSQLDEDSDSDSYSSTCSSSGSSSSSSSSSNNNIRPDLPNNYRLENDQSKLYWGHNEVGLPNYYQNQTSYLPPPPPSPRWTSQKQVNSNDTEYHYNHQRSSVPNQPSCSYTHASVNAPHVMSDISEEISDDEEIHGKIHVVHFGIV